MTNELENPFRITKSNNLTDAQIDEYWVTPDNDEDAASLFRPESRMAMFILGGKGSGKSHLMRYYGYPLQKIRFAKRKQSIADGIGTDGYVGIYALCKAMDAHRFSGKGQSIEKWSDLFAYYFELWITDRTLNLLAQLANEGSISSVLEDGILSSFVNLFDVAPRPLGSFDDAREYLSEIRKEVDFAVNNVTMTGVLNVTIRCTRGRLLFGLPSIVEDMFLKFRSVTFIYLLDEFENFDDSQQAFINTLIREAEGPVSFKIGARLYGLRTTRILGTDELNREGSEYEIQRLDDRHRRDPKAYAEFSHRIILRRLSATLSSDDTRVPQTSSQLDKLFETENFSFDSPLFKDLFKLGQLRPHQSNLREKLLKGVREGLAEGVTSVDQIQSILDALSFGEYPLLEKISILSLYQHWARGNNLVDATVEVRTSALEYISGVRSNQFSEFFNKYRSDMVAQLLRENGRPQIYAGLSTFIRQSEGLPRALITTLKHTYDWAVYTKDRALLTEPFSIRSQQRGASDAARWFLDEMLMEGEDGVLVQSAVHRLAQLFRVNRFSDKPIETSMIAFSVDRIQLDAEAARILTLAIKTSLLIDVDRGQRERNSEQVTSKLELNTMLSPRYDLPTARRGTVPISTREANIIFCRGASKEFEELLKDWSAKMTAPGFGRGRSNRDQRQPSQPSLL